MGNAAQKTSGNSEINWVEFNYPPFIRLIHFDLAELPAPLASLVRFFNISFQVTVFTCMLNFFDTAIIVMSTNAPARWLLQSAIHLLLLPVGSLATFYCGYRGLA